MIIGNLVLQSIVLPNDICPEKSLFLRANGGCEFSDHTIILSAGSSFSTDTYMNIFDVGFWNKYTSAVNFEVWFRVKGKGNVRLYSWEGDTEQLVFDQRICNREFTQIFIPFKYQGKREKYYLKVISKDGLWLEDMKFYTVEKLPLRDVSLGVNICTYKRNKEILRNLQCLKDSRFFFEEDDLYGKMTVQIVDNGSELPEIQEKYISLVHNPNTGGSGGFLRGLQELRRKEAENKITHIIFMDDDVLFHPESFYRLYAFLSLLRDEYKEEVVAGRMFRLDRRHIQYTAAEIWNGGDIIHVGENLNMLERESLKKVNESNGEYTGWWFGCFPMSFARKNDPLPFFIHCDDVEYGLRHGGCPIVMNGVQVWHETYEYRQSPVMAYYDIRNSLIVNSLYDYSKSSKLIINEFKKKITAAHVQNKYLEEFMIIRAYFDYARSWKWFVNKNGLRLHKHLMKYKISNKHVNAIAWRITVLFLTKKMRNTKENRG